MADALREGAAAPALAVAANPRNCDFAIVRQNRDRHAAKKSKCRDVPIAKGFRGLRRIGLDAGGWASGTTTSREPVRVRPT